MLKRFVLSVYVLALLLISPVVFASTFGTNITVYDGQTAAYSSWYGTQEDQETEPGTTIGQKWDLEAFYLSGSQLTMVGGYDFKNGYLGTTSGDIFISTLSSGNYNYVVDLNFSNNSYVIREIDTTTILAGVNYSNHTYASPWKYVSGGVDIVSGSFSYLTGLTDAYTGLLGGSHNAVTGIDIAAILTNSMLFHNTMSCGNDNLIARVPEPGTLALFGFGILALAGFRRAIKK